MISRVGNIVLDSCNKKYAFFVIFMIKNCHMQVGGSEEAYLAAEPLFLSMGKSTVYCGGAGNGSVSSQTWRYNI